jgi:thioesterase domain-containing protein
MGWQGFTTGGLEIREIPGGHLTMTAQPNVRVLADYLGDYRTRLRAGRPRG